MRQFMPTEAVGSPVFDLWASQSCTQGGHLSRGKYCNRHLASSMYSFQCATDHLPIPPIDLRTRYEGYGTWVEECEALPVCETTISTHIIKLYSVEAPKNYGKSTLPIAFDFPTDWLAIDKLGGGIQYVDQRNGNKLYVLRASLPEGSNLRTVNKSWFSDVVLSPDGDVVRSGITVEGGRTSFSRMISDCTAEDAPTPCTNRRRLTIKYDTVTGSGVQTVERRGLVDAWQVKDEAYLMLTTATAVKFDKKGMERDTLEAIVDSFKVGEGVFS